MGPLRQSVYGCCVSTREVRRSLMSASSPVIFVTGGAGFIGSHWVRYLLQHTNAQVVNLDALTYAGNLQGWGPWLEHPRHLFYHGSIGDAELVKKIIETHRPQAVVHLAAESHVDRSIDGPSIFVETNVLGTTTLLREVESYWRQLPQKQRDSFRFLHLSTDEVFGSLGPEEAPFTELTPYAPRSPYSASKAAADHMVRAWQDTYGLPTVIVHCSNNYGPRQFPEKLIPLAIVRMLHDEPIPLYGDGMQVRDWVHVEDHCRALACLFEKAQSGERYVIGSGREITNRDLLEKVCAVMDEQSPHPRGVPYASLMTHVNDRPGHDRRYAIDAALIRKNYDWQPQIPIEQGLRDTVSWYLENREWWLQILQQGSKITQRRGVIPFPHRQL